ncbi:outer membrane beta-barrel domain-containing protein [Haliangium ochraceum]|nr:outer membrane beta-barrel domain-containing protein [Haliangium ochraceum]
MLVGMVASVRGAQAQAALSPSTSEVVPSARPSDAPLPSCDDTTLTQEISDRAETRGVQKRVFLKDKHFQLTARGGLFAADLLSSSYIVGGSLAYYLTEDLALEASFDLTPVDLDLDKPLAEFFGDRRFSEGMGYLVLGGLLWSPIHAKLKMAGSIVHADILVAAGAGRLLHDSVQGVSFDAGMVLELYTSQWVTFRFDVRNLMAVQEAVSETRLTNNIIATAGLSLWIPSGL